MTRASASAFLSRRAVLRVARGKAPHRGLNRKPAAERDQDDAGNEDEPADHSPLPRPAKPMKASDSVPASMSVSAAP